MHYAHKQPLNHALHTRAYTCCHAHALRLSPGQIQPDPRSGTSVQQAILCHASSLHCSGAHMHTATLKWTERVSFKPLQSKGQIQVLPRKGQVQACPEKISSSNLSGVKVTFKLLPWRSQIPSLLWLSLWSCYVSRTFQMTNCRASTRAIAVLRKKHSRWRTSKSRLKLIIFGDNENRASPTQVWQMTCSMHSLLKVYTMPLTVSQDSLLRSARRLWWFQSCPFSRVKNAFVASIVLSSVCQRAYATSTARQSKMCGLNCSMFFRIKSFRCFIRETEQCREIQQNPSVSTGRNHDTDLP